MNALFPKQIKSMDRQVYPSIFSVIKDVF